MENKRIQIDSNPSASSNTHITTKKSIQKQQKSSSLHLNKKQKWQQKQRILSKQRQKQQKKQVEQKEGQGQRIGNGEKEGGNEGEGSDVEVEEDIINNSSKYAGIKVTAKRSSLRKRLSRKSGISQLSAQIMSLGNLQKEQQNIQEKDQSQLKSFKLQKKSQQPKPSNPPKNQTELHSISSFSKPFASPIPSQCSPSISQSPNPPASPPISITPQSFTHTQYPNIFPLGKKIYGLLQQNYYSIIIGSIDQESTNANASLNRNGNQKEIIYIERHAIPNSVLAYGNIMGRNRVVIMQSINIITMQMQNNKGQNNKPVTYLHINITTYNIKTRQTISVQNYLIQYTIPTNNETASSSTPLQQNYPSFSYPSNPSNIPILNLNSFNSNYQSKSQSISSNPIQSSFPTSAKLQRQKQRQRQRQKERQKEQQELKQRQKDMHLRSMQIYKQIRKIGLIVGKKYASDQKNDLRQQQEQGEAEAEEREGDDSFEQDGSLDGTSKSLKLSDEQDEQQFDESEEQDFKQSEENVNIQKIYKQNGKYLQSKNRKINKIEESEQWMQFDSQMQQEQQNQLKNQREKERERQKDYNSLDNSQISIQNHFNQKDRLNRLNNLQKKRRKSSKKSKFNSLKNKNQLRAQNKNPFIPGSPKAKKSKANIKNQKIDKKVPLIKNEKQPHQQYLALNFSPSLHEGAEFLAQPSSVEPLFPIQDSKISIKINNENNSISKIQQYNCPLSSVQSLSTPSSSASASHTHSHSSSQTLISKQRPLARARKRKSLKDKLQIFQKRIQKRYEVQIQIRKQKERQRQRLKNSKEDSQNNPHKYKYKNMCIILQLYNSTNPQKQVQKQQNTNKFLQKIISINKKVDENQKANKDASHAQKQRQRQNLQVTNTMNGLSNSNQNLNMNIGNSNCNTLTIYSVSIPMQVQGNNQSQDCKLLQENMVSRQDQKQRSKPHFSQFQSHSSLYKIITPKILQPQNIKRSGSINRKQEETVQKQKQQQQNTYQQIITYSQYLKQNERIINKNWFYSWDRNFCKEKNNEKIQNNFRSTTMERDRDRKRQRAMESNIKQNRYIESCQELFGCSKILNIVTNFNIYEIFIEHSGYGVNNQNGSEDENEDTDDFYNLNFDLKISKSKRQSGIALRNRKRSSTLRKSHKNMKILQQCQTNFNNHYYNINNLNLNPTITKKLQNQLQKLKLSSKNKNIDLNLNVNLLNNLNLNPNPNVNSNNPLSKISKKNIKPRNSGSKNPRNSRKQSRRLENIQLSSQIISSQNQINSKNLKQKQKQRLRQKQKSKKFGLQFKTIKILEKIIDYESSKIANIKNQRQKYHNQSYSMVGSSPSNLPIFNPLQIVTCIFVSAKHYLLLTNSNILYQIVNNRVINSQNLLSIANQYQHNSISASNADLPSQPIQYQATPDSEPNNLNLSHNLNHNLNLAFSLSLLHKLKPKPKHYTGQHLKIQQIDYVYNGGIGYMGYGYNHSAGMHEGGNGIIVARVLVVADVRDADPANGDADGATGVLYEVQNQFYVYKYNKRWIQYYGKLDNFINQKIMNNTNIQPSHTNTHTHQSTHYHPTQIPTECMTPLCPYPPSLGPSSSLSPSPTAYIQKYNIHPQTLSIKVLNNQNFIDSIWGQEQEDHRKEVKVDGKGRIGKNAIGSNTLQRNQYYLYCQWGIVQDYYDGQFVTIIDRSQHQVKDSQSNMSDKDGIKYSNFSELQPLLPQAQIQMYIAQLNIFGKYSKNGQDLNPLCIRLQDYYNINVNNVFNVSYKCQRYIKTSNVQTLSPFFSASANIFTLAILSQHPSHTLTLFHRSTPSPSFSLPVHSFPSSFSSPSSLHIPPISPFIPTLYHKFHPTPTSICIDNLSLNLIASYRQKLIMYSILKDKLQKISQLCIGKIIEIKYDRYNWHIYGYTKQKVYIISPWKFQIQRQLVFYGEILQMSIGQFVFVRWRERISQAVFLTVFPLYEAISEDFKTYETEIDGWVCKGEMDEFMEVCGQLGNTRKVQSDVGKGRRASRNARRNSMKQGKISKSQQIELVHKYDAHAQSSTLFIINQFYIEIHKMTFTSVFDRWQMIDDEQYYRQLYQNIGQLSSHKSNQSKLSQSKHKKQMEIQISLHKNVNMKKDKTKSPKKAQTSLKIPQPETEVGSKHNIKKSRFSHKIEQIPNLQNIQKSNCHIADKQQSTVPLVKTNQIIPQKMHQNTLPHPDQHGDCHDIQFCIQQFIAKIITNKRKSATNINKSFSNLNSNSSSINNSNIVNKKISIKRKSSIFYDENIKNLINLYTSATRNNSSNVGKNYANNNNNDRIKQQNSDQQQSILQKQSLNASQHKNKKTAKTIISGPIQKCPVTPNTNTNINININLKQTIYHQQSHQSIDSQQSQQSQYSIVTNTINNSMTTIKTQSQHTHTHVHAPTHTQPQIVNGDGSDRNDHADKYTQQQEILTEKILNIFEQEENIVRICVAFVTNNAYDSADINANYQSFKQFPTCFKYQPSLSILLVGTSFGRLVGYRYEGTHFNQNHKENLSQKKMMENNQNINLNGQIKKGNNGMITMLPFYSQLITNQRIQAIMVGKNVLSQCLYLYTGNQNVIGFRLWQLKDSQNNKSLPLQNYTKQSIQQSSSSQLVTNPAINPTQFTMSSQNTFHHNNENILKQLHNFQNFNNYHHYFPTISSNPNPNPNSRCHYQSNSSANLTSNPSLHRFSHIKIPNLIERQQKINSTTPESLQSNGIFPAYPTYTNPFSNGSGNGLPSMHNGVAPTTPTPLPQLLPNYLGQHSIQTLLSNTYRLYTPQSMGGLCNQIQQLELKLMKIKGDREEMLIKNKKIFQEKILKEEQMLYRVRVEKKKEENKVIMAGKAALARLQGFWAMEREYLGGVLRKKMEQEYRQQMRKLYKQNDILKQQYKSLQSQSVCQIQKVFKQNYHSLSILSSSLSSSLLALQQKICILSSSSPSPQSLKVYLDSLTQQNKLLIQSLLESSQNLLVTQIENSNSLSYRNTQLTTKINEMRQKLTTMYYISIQLKKQLQIWKKQNKQQQREQWLKQLQKIKEILQRKQKCIENANKNILPSLVLSISHRKYEIGQKQQKIGELQERSEAIGKKYQSMIGDVQIKEGNLHAVGIFIEEKLAYLSKLKVRRENVLMRKWIARESLRRGVHAVWSIWEEMVWGGIGKHEQSHEKLLILKLIQPFEYQNSCIDYINQNFPNIQIINSPKNYKKNQQNKSSKTCNPNQTHNTNSQTKQQNKCETQTDIQKYSKILQNRTYFQKISKDLHKKQQIFAHSLEYEQVYNQNKELTADLNIIRMNTNQLEEKIKKIKKQLEKYRRDESGIKIIGKKQKIQISKSRRNLATQILIQNYKSKKQIANQQKSHIIKKQQHKENKQDKPKLGISNQKIKNQIKTNKKQSQSMHSQSISYAHIHKFSQASRKYEIIHGINSRQNRCLSQLSQMETRKVKMFNNLRLNTVIQNCNNVIKQNNKKQSNSQKSIDLHGQVNRKFSLDSLKNRFRIFSLSHQPQKQKNKHPIKSNQISLKKPTKMANPKTKTALKINPKQKLSLGVSIPPSLYAHALNPNPSPNHLPSPSLKTLKPIDYNPIQKLIQNWSMKYRQLELQQQGQQQQLQLKLQLQQKKHKQIQNQANKYAYSLSQKINELSHNVNVNQNANIASLKITDQKLMKGKDK